MEFIYLLFFITISYLSGSLCSAVIISKLFSLPDPRTEGSKNPGATNVLRLAGKKYAILVLVADMLKGFLPILLAKFFTLSATVLTFSCFAAVLGHMYPLFFNFKGGKGVATALGALLGLNFMLGIAVTALWLTVAHFSRYSSLASLISLGFSPFLALFVFGHFELPLLFMVLFIFFKHKDNLIRLIDGKEPKIKLKNTSLAGEAIAASLAEDEEKSD